MSDWLFLGERTEAEAVFQLGVNCRDGQCFRFEPIATKLRGNSVGMLRQELGRRIANDTDQYQGIIPVIGPIFYQDRYWLGWKDRNGRSLFGFEPRLGKPLRDELADLYQLINSYKLWHQQGLTVGRPEWRRLIIDDRGLFMLDPKPAFYLAQPCVNPPVALERCRPAEEYRNLTPTCYGDLFYLGLIIYYYLTGEVPFLLRKGWPTQNILAGKIINPQLYRKLPSGLGQTIISMLAPEPAQRPTADVVLGLWNEYLKRDRLFEKSNFNDDHLIGVKAKVGNNIKKAVSMFAIFLSILGLLTIGYRFFYAKFSNGIKITPVETAAKFYQEMGRFNFRNHNGITTNIFKADFEAAFKRRLDTVRTLFSKPIFEVDQMQIIEEMDKTAVIGVDLIWWEWSVKGWEKRHSYERLVYQKEGKQMKLVSREVETPIK